MKRRHFAFVLPICLYLIGVLHWLLFLDFGDIPFGNFDWQSMYAFLEVQREAMTSLTVPFHISSPLSYTDRFMALPTTILSPQVLALPFLPANVFIVGHILLLYSIGYAGSLVLKRATGWSWSAFAIFFLLFNFNGHITAHLAVGHLEWCGYFLLPWFFLLMLGWARSGPTPVMAVAVAIVLFGIWLQGFFHLALWCLAFVFLLSVRSRRWLGFAALTAVVWVFVSAVRLGPAMLAYAGVEREFLGGFTSWRDLLAGLVSIRYAHLPYFDSGSVATGLRLGWWEYDFYLGWFGLAFLLFFGVWLRIGNNRSMRALKFRMFDIPIGVLAVFSLGRIYEVLYRLPLLSSERGTTRFLLLPLLTLAIVGCTRLDRWIAIKPLRKWKSRVVGIGIVGIVVSLAVHSWVWAIGNLKAVTFPETVVGVPGIVVRADPGYVTVVVVGAVVSAISIAAGLVYVLRNRRVLGRAVLPG